MDIILAPNQKQTSRVTDALFQSIKGLDRTYHQEHHPRTTDHHISGYIFKTRKELNEHLINFANAVIGSHIIDIEVLREAKDSYGYNMFQIN